MSLIIGGDIRLETSGIAGVGLSERFQGKENIDSKIQEIPSCVCSFNQFAWHSLTTHVEGGGDERGEVVDMGHTLLLRRPSAESI